MLGAVVLKDDARGPAVAHALNHRRVVRCVGEENAARQPRAQRGQRRVVGNVAGREQQRRLLLVQVRLV